MAPQLPSRPSLDQLKHQAKDLLKAHHRGERRVYDTLRLLLGFAESSVEDVLASKVTLQQVQHALAASYGFRNWSALKRYCTRVRPLRYSIREGRCDPRYTEELAVSIAEVLGTSLTVATGEQFLVRGEYTLKEGAAVARLMLSGLGRNTGKPAHLSPGSGQFELTTELLEAQPDRELYLDILMADSSGKVLGTRARIVLEERSAEDDSAG